ncbi:MAG: hypothetical protein WEB09_09200 [Nitriliruptor sp.]
MSRRRSALSLSSALVLGVAGSAAAGPWAGASGCDLTGAVARAEVTAELSGDGTPRDVRHLMTAESSDGSTCRTSGRGDAVDLPVDVAVLHSTPVEGSLEAEELDGASGPVTTRIAVRDRTATTRQLRVDPPSGDERIERRVGVPHLVRVAVTYPASWTAIAPQVPGTHTDTAAGGLRVTRSELLFPPITADEVVVAIAAAPGRGTPEVTVEVTPLADPETARAAAGELDRDAAAVVAALAEVGAEGAARLADGTTDLAEGIGELAGGADELADGLGDAAAGGTELRAGADELAAGAAQLAVGMRQLATGLQPLAEGARRVAEGNRELADGLAAGADAADELADGSGQLATGSRELGAAARELNAGLAALRAGIEGLPDLGPVTDAVVGPASEVMTGVEEVGTAGAELAGAAGELERGNRELARELRAAAAASRELAEGSDRVADGAEEAAAGSEELATSSEQLAAGSERFAGAVDDYTRGVERAAGASAELADGADEAADGAAGLADGAQELPSPLREARDTADRAGARQAETAAIVAAGRELAEDRVDAVLGGAATGTLDTELVVAGSSAPPFAAALGLVAVLGTGGVAGRLWWRQRTEVAS